MSRISNFFFILFLLFLPFQLSFHWWIPEALVLGRRIDYLAPTLYISDFFLLIACVLVLPKLLQFSRNVIFSFFLLIGISFISLYVSKFKLLSIFATFKLVEFFLLFILVKALKPSFKQILLPLLVASLAVSLIAVAQFMQQSSLGGLFYFLGERTFTSASPGIAQVQIAGRLFLRPYSTLPHPNVLAGFLAILIPLFLLLPKEKLMPKEYILRNASILLSLVALFLSFSRIAWFIVIINSLVIFMQSKRKTRSIVFFILVLAAMLVVEELFIGRLSSFITSDSQSLRERQKLFTAAVSMIKASPIIGVGLGNFIPQLPHYSTPPYLLQPVHMIYALIWAETGLIGLGGFCWLAVKTFYLAKIKNQLPLLLSFSSILILGFFDHYFLTLQQTRLELVLIIALIWTGQTVVSDKQ